ncbi:carboxymuconolactone decarboxylase family protein [Streptomyces sp. NBC_01622]|uniref:carboxymuconolactone decarboxylase family protein n=1 Tax=Streptomyces sp. NBC_01622 TaxID=2975903 RepID=UPI003868F0C7|nr:carboxymuconolactone decarboxylase family protein [Streptomyces sp. NBC_01622]
MRLSAPTGTGPEQAELGERIRSRRGAVGGPFLVWLRNPALGDHLEALGTYCLRESSLPLRLRELALLVAARHFDAQHSWNAHLAKAVDAGVDPAALQRLARGEEPRFSSPDEEVLHRFASEALEGHFVGDETFAAGLEHFGEPGLVDLVAALGTFSMFAMALNVFQVDLQADHEPPFPDVKGFRRT